MFAVNDLVDVNLFESAEALELERKPLGVSLPIMLVDITYPSRTSSFRNYRSNIYQGDPGRLADGNSPHLLTLVVEPLVHLKPV